MNKPLIALLFTFFFSNIYSQENYNTLPATKNNCPIILIEKNIIANETIIAKNKTMIIEMSVLKDKPNRKEHKFYNLSQNGILFVTLNKKIAFKTQSELNKFFGISKKNNVYVNGYLLESSDYKIATQSILEIELVQPNSENKLEGTAINIWTLNKEERTKDCNKRQL
ncbi:hypothetical protein [Flavobacterium piscis]|uniref:Uncharacterized protein n=1 Tax=Flavobacterium piscis TaxID=1114874 RepID=A0ABU1Y663_9FLAO|nr:hypothetical protein [Flavobacterium piscis]MDR7209553.1 hypothetical protein [Flavobacterium piscis]